MTTVDRLMSAVSALALLAAGTGPAMAQQPQGGTVSAGSAAIKQNGTRTDIVQTTDKAVIDWQGFSVGAGSSVQFQQPNAGSITLNRVRGADASRIDGAIGANGRVVIVNPNGVMVGPTGTIDVGGLVATTSDVGNEDFMAGRMRFDQPGKTGATVVNRGRIRVGEQGYAVLSSAATANGGTIEARLGTVVLGGAEAFTLDLDGDRLLSYQVTKPVAAAAAPLVTNAGAISAEGGRVILSARAAKGVVDTVINTSGLIQAGSATLDGGTIVIDGGDTGVVQASGRIEAVSQAGKGGTVEVLGDKVGLMAGAAIDVSGSSGGGTARVGGDWQGGGTTRRASVTYVDAKATVAADATVKGNGGTVAVWADDTTRFHGKVTARGAGSGSTGGKVETSGKRVLEATGTVQVQSILGAPGVWLLDPWDVTIGSGTSGGSYSGGTFTPSTSGATVDAAAITASLESGGNVLVQTSGGGGETGTISVTSAILPASGAGGSLTLLADGGISVGSQIGQSGGGSFSLTLAAAGHVGVDGTIFTNGGSLTIGGLANPTGAPALGTSANYVGVTIASNITTNGGAISIRGQGWSGASSGGDGIIIGNSTLISSGSGAIMMDGAAAGAGTADRGIYLDNSAQVTSTSGAISLHGSAAGSGGGSGINTFKNTNIGSVSGAISLQGEGGPGADNNTGIFTAGSITSSSGNITLAGTGGNATGTGNIGLQLSAVSTGGAGSIQISGTRGSGIDGNTSVRIVGPISTVDGALGITGNAGGTTSGSNNIGVEIGNNVSTGTGGLTLDGTGGGGTDNNVSVQVNNQVTSTSGTIQVTGRAGGATSGLGNDGVQVSGASITSPVALTVTGTASHGTGVLMTNDGTIRTNAGQLTIAGTGSYTGVAATNGGGAISAGDLVIQGSAPTIGIQSGSGSLGFQTNGTGSISLAASSGKISLETDLSVTGAGNISLSTPLGISLSGQGRSFTADTGSISLDALGSGDLTTNGAGSVSIASGTGVGALTINNSGNVTVSGALSANSLTIGSAANITLGGVTTLSGNADLTATGNLAINSSLSATAATLGGAITASGLTVSSLTVSGASAVMTGTVGGQTGAPAAVATLGPAGVPTHTMNGFLLGTGDPGPAPPAPPADPVVPPVVIVTPPVTPIVPPVIPPVTPPVLPPTTPVVPTPPVVVTPTPPATIVITDLPTDVTDRITTLALPPAPPNQQQQQQQQNAGAPTILDGGDQGGGTSNTVSSGNQPAAAVEVVIPGLLVLRNGFADYVPVKVPGVSNRYSSFGNADSW